MNKKVKQFLNNLHSKYKMDLLNKNNYSCGNNKEYNLTIQQVLQHENVGKYFKTENKTQITFYLQEGEYLELEFIIVKDERCIFNEYSLAQEELFLTDIVNTMYKEVDYKC